MKNQIFNSISFYKTIATCVLLVCCMMVNAQTITYSIFADDVTAVKPSPKVTPASSLPSPPPLTVTGLTGGVTSPTGRIGPTCTIPLIYDFTFGSPVQLDVNWEDCKEACVFTYAPASIDVQFNLSLHSNFDALNPASSIDVLFNGNLISAEPVSGNVFACPTATSQVVYAVCVPGAYYNAGGTNTLSLVGPNPVNGVGNNGIGLAANDSWGGAYARIYARYCHDLQVDFTSADPYTLTAADLESMLPEGGQSGSAALIPGTMMPKVFSCNDAPNCVEITFTDVSSCNHGGALSRCTVELTTFQPALPECISQDITLGLVGDGCVSLTAEQIDNGSSSCNGYPILDRAIDINRLCCEDIGANTVTLTVTNVSGSSSCTATVTIEDNIPPILYCPANKTIALDAGECATTASEAAPFATDNCGEATVTQTAAPTGDLVPGGVYTFSYTAEDANGNVSDECTYSVEIIPFENPSESLTCNDQITVSANADCEVDISYADLILEGGPYGCYTDYEISIEPQYNPDALIEVVVTVTDPATNNSCWGIVTVEDKNEPTVLCDGCADDFGFNGDAYDEDCKLMCYEVHVIKDKYWDNLRDDLIPEDVGDFIDDHVVSSCVEYNEKDVSWYDSFADNGACGGTQMTRTWTLNYTDANGNLASVSCQKYYFFEPLGLETAIEARYECIDADGDGDDDICIPEAIEDTLLLPKAVVEIQTCGVDISPAGIQAFFDSPATVDQNTDDDDADPDELDIDCVVENNEGTWYAYPHYYMFGRSPSGPHAQAITDETCNLLVQYTDQAVDACAEGCEGNLKVIRNWTILDWCTAEFINYEQVIKVVDDVAPVLSVNGRNASVDAWKCSADILIPAPEHLSDNCDDNLAVTAISLDGHVVTGSLESGFVIRDVGLGSARVRFEAADCCGNVTKEVVTFNVVDNTPPVAVTKEFTVVSLTNIGNPVDSEDNGIAKVYAQDLDNGSYDSCTPVTVQIRRVGVACDDADLEWGDNVKFCCADLENATFDDVNGNGVQDQDERSYANIDVEVRVVDNYGNENVGWATVRVEDKSAPAIFCPQSMIVSCDMDLADFAMTGWPEYYSACGQIFPEIDTLEILEDTEADDKLAAIPPLVDIDGDGLPDAVPEYNTSCGYGAVRRRWDCGDQWFVIIPTPWQQIPGAITRLIPAATFDPSTITFPGDVLVDCDDYDTGEPAWQEAVCNLVGSSLVASDTFLFEDGACYKILNQWSVVDWCVFDPSVLNSPGRYEHTQVIKLIDTQDPVVSAPDSLCFAVTEECSSKGVTLSASAEDNGDCGSEWIGWEVVIDAYADWSADYTYSTSNPSQLDGEPNLYHIPKSGNGEDITIVLPDGIPSSKIWHRAVFRAYDGCNNTASVTRYFQVVDKKAPTPYCLNLSTAVMEPDADGNSFVDLWAIDFNVGSFDNCSEDETLLFTFTDVAPPPRNDSEYDSDAQLMWYNGTEWYYDSTLEFDPNGDPRDYYYDLDEFGDEIHAWNSEFRSSARRFTIDDADANGFAQVPIYVWDECGNVDFCLVNLRITDNNGGGSAMVAGRILTETGAGVSEVNTQLSGGINLNVNKMSNTQGEFAFDDMFMYLDYQLSGEKNDDYLNGVSTLDLVLIQKHILGNEQLNSAYKMIAADANNDKNITAVDLLELRKLILGVYDELPENGSWKFVDASDNLTLTNPWVYNESRSVLGLEEDVMNEDMIAVKIGDVNGSVETSLSSTSVDRRSGASMELDFEDRAVKAGELVELTLSTDREDIYGFQLTMNMLGLELQTVESGLLREENVAMFDSKLTMSYGSTLAMESGSVVTLSFKATQSGMLSELIRLSNDITRTEAYAGGSLEVIDIDLRGGDQLVDFALYQNEPNPFADQTVIGFELPEAGVAKISLFDVTGKVLRVIEGDFNKGYNTVTVQKSDVNATGVVYYKLQTTEHTATRHMIMIE